ncbi:Serine/threonine-protein kinase mTOR, partial [Araneus ventricosus]
MTASTVMQQFVSGLKSKNEDVRFRTTRDLHHYVTTELREMSIEDVSAFLDEFNHHIFEMVSSSDVNDRKGGTLAIVCLLGINVGNTATRTSRFVNYLRNLLPSTDTGVMELAAYAIGRLALVSGTYTAEYVEFEAKRAFEWLSGDRHESKRHAAVLVLRELAVSTPTFFFQQVQQFFDCIFNATCDPKPSIRESAAAALRAALVVTAQRETKETQKTFCYKAIYEVAVKGFNEAVKEKGVTRDDKIHGSLLVINELLRCSNVEGEMTRQELEDIIQQQATHEAHGHHRYTFLKELGQGSLTRSFRALHQLHHNNQGSSQKGIGLSAVVRYHKALGTYPGDLMPSRRTQVCESNTCKQLMNEHFDTVCQQVLRYKSIKNLHIQQTLLNILPRLAAFQTKRFVANYLSETMAYLLSCLKRDRERYNSFNAVGLLAVAVKLEIKPYIPKIMDVIRASLPSKDATIRKKVPQMEPAVFTCISMLGRAVGHTIMQDIKELLEPMMATGLSPALTASLRELASQIPQLKKDIQEGLLKMLSVVLMRRSLRHPGMPKHLASQAPSSGLHQGLLDVSDVASITLALKTLGSFDFQGRSLMLFVRYCAENYLSSEVKEIRLEAVRTCCKLLSPAIQGMKASGRYSPHIMGTVQEVLAKLLVVGVTDSDQNVRYSVLASLDEKFDPHLAQSENLSALFIALNDEMFEIRELALCSLGRLSSVNPAYVMPALRKELIQILTELEHSGIGRNKEQSAKMLGHLSANAPRLIRPYMEPVLNVLIPKLRDPDPNPGVTIAFLAGVGELAQPLVRNLDTVPDLRPTAMDTLCSVVIQLGKKYQIFIPMVHKVLTKHRINHQRYDVLISRIIKGTAAEDTDDPLMYAKKKNKSPDADISATSSDVGNPRRKLPINVFNLQRAWASTRRVSRDDWLEWLKRMSVVLLKESPSPALRSCCALAESYDQLLKDMFNAIFLSCWSELQEKQQAELAESLQLALTTQNIPEITQTLLNLAEFMEHCEKGPLPLKSTLLGEKAMECRAYAKALHYKEDEFHKGPTSEILETLISINNKLHQPEAAAGVLEYAMKNHGAELKVKERWYEKLHKWDKALAAYQQAREQRPDDMELIMGQMRCLEVLGEWGQLYQLSTETWPAVDDSVKTKMAPIAAAAAWGLGHWESMEEYTRVIPRATTDSAFYQAILSIHHSDFHAAQLFIDKARDLLDTELTALAGESYSRAYGAMVHVQMFSELEEVIQYKLIPERREAIKQKWWDRLQGCQRIVEDWQKIMQVHSLVVSPQEDMRSWLKYASLCRRAGRLV